MCIDNNISCLLNHSRPKTRLQDTCLYPRMSQTPLSFLALHLHRITRIYQKIPYVTFTNDAAWRGVSYTHATHGAKREMAVMAVPCAYDTPRQIASLLNVTYGHSTIFLRDYVEIKCREAEEYQGHTRILAVSWLCSKFAVRHELACIQCYTRCIGFALGFRPRVSALSTELYVSR